MNNFEFATARRIIFGEGTRKRIPEVARGFGTRALIVTGKNSERSAWLVADLGQRGFECSVVAISGEPTIDIVEAGAKTARESKAEIVIAVGGGSAIDAGKAIAALAANPGNPLDYLEVIGKALPLAVDPLPFIAVPTTAGTGAEVTRNAVLSSKKHQLKVSLRSPKMLPVAAVVDPELTYDVPPDVTASTGLDALTQLIEPFLCTKANSISDALCRGSPARFQLRFVSRVMAKRGARWRSGVFPVAWRSRMRGLGRCMALRRRLAECLTRRTEQFARRFCRA